MTWMAITQCVFDNAHQERHDSVAQCWSSIAVALGYMPIHLPMLDAKYASELLNKLSPGALVLTGGNSIHDIPARDQFESALLKAAVNMHIPVLGVCRGMQLINMFYGGVISPIDAHVGERHLITFTDNLMQKREVNSYHEFGILEKNLGQGIKALALASDGTVEALQHQVDRVTGMMWHPEREAMFSDEDKYFMLDALR